MSRVLWADDDAKGVLVALQWLLEAKELRVSAVRDYVAAVRLLEERQGNEALAFQAAIIDVILIHASNGATIDGDLGLRLAAEVAAKGVARVAFLSVVPSAVFAVDLERLRGTYPGTTFRPFDKLSILDPGQIEELTTFVGQVEKGKGGG